jgi:hypothetical protein
MSTFNLDIKAFTEKAGKNADQVVRKICLDLLSNIVYNTPVDTGRARANWFTSIGSPVSTTIEFNASASSAAGVAVAQASADIAKATGNLFWISNNLPYIYRLEFEQWSKQAPNGMVRLAINKAERSIR